MELPKTKTASMKANETSALKIYEIWNENKTNKDFAIGNVTKILKNNYGERRKVRTGYWKDCHIILQELF